MHHEPVGKLNVGTTRATGKIIDTWSFQSPFEGQSGPDMSATISIDKASGDGITFVARSAFLPAAIADTDINRLREKVEEALRRQHDIITGVVWEDWLEVQVRGGRVRQEARATESSQLEVTYRVLKRGVHPQSGIAYTLNSNGTASPFPKPKRAGEIDPENAVSDEAMAKHGLRLGGREKDCEFSYLPATQENLAGLEELVERMQALRERWCAFLRQDTVERSLSDLANQIPALPAPL